MAKRVFASPFQGVLEKEIYPTQFNPGDVCPAELIEAAEICGALEPVEDGGGKGKAKKSGAAGGVEQAQG